MIGVRLRRARAGGEPDVPSGPGALDVVLPWAEPMRRDTLPDRVALTRATAGTLSADLGLLLARLVLGGLSVLAGARTLFAIPAGTGGGPAAATALLTRHGFVLPDVLTRVLGWAGLVAGLLVVLGTFASFAAAVLLAPAVTAVGVTVPAAVAGGDAGPVAGPLLALTVAAVVVLAGPGHVAGDAGRAWHRAQTPVGLVCLLLGVATGLTVLFAFR